ncbi:hypothetical protein FQN50_005990 [Emmonsiellopsis sp. PD_5]|nr:hypothetical protein FQN50_005990 [Emmonsiellopsis sp. PD_5]
MDIVVAKTLSTYLARACEAAEKRGENKLRNDFFYDAQVTECLKAFLKLLPAKTTAPCQHQRQSRRRQQRIKESNASQATLPTTTTTTGTIQPHFDKWKANPATFYQQLLPEEEESLLSSSGEENPLASAFTFLRNGIGTSDSTTSSIVNRVRRRVLYVLFSRLKAAFGRVPLRKLSLQLLAQIIKNSEELVEEELSLDGIVGILGEWAAKGDRYESIADELGGLGVLVVLPDGAGDSFWEKHLPRKGDERRGAIALLVAQGVPDEANRIGAHQVVQRIAGAAAFGFSVELQDDDSDRSRHPENPRGDFPNSNSHNADVAQMVTSGLSFDDGQGGTAQTQRTLDDNANLQANSIESYYYPQPMDMIRFDQPEAASRDTAGVGSQMTDLGILADVTDEYSSTIECPTLNQQRMSQSVLDPRFPRPSGLTTVSLHTNNLHVHGGIRTPFAGNERVSQFDCNDTQGSFFNHSYVPLSPSPPQSLLISENLFHNIKIYFSNSCRNMILDDQGTLLAPNGTKLDTNDLCDFDSYFFTAAMLVEKGLPIDFRRALSKASALVEQLLRAEHPRTLACFLEVFIHLIQVGLPEVTSFLRDFVKGMAAKVTRKDRPWGQICRLLGELGSDESLDQAMAQVWKCSTDTFDSELGTHNRLAVAVRLDYIKRVHGVTNYLEEERLLRDLLAQFRDIPGLSAPRVMLNLAHNLNRQGRHDEAEAMGLQVLLLLREYHEMYAGRIVERIESLKVVSHSQFYQGKMVAAEQTMREAIGMIVDQYGVRHSWVPEFMNVLEGWLRSWGREEDANALWGEIEGLMGGDEIDELA